MPPKYGALELAGRVLNHIEEFSRTFYITSSGLEEHGDADVVDTVVDSAEFSTTHPHAHPGVSRIRRTKSETSLSVNHAVSESSADPPPPNVNYHRYRPSHSATSKTSILPNDLPPIVTHTPTGTPKARSVPPFSSFRYSTAHWPRHSRPRVLFYHKHDPHYGFTNFSPHSVQYMGKRFPTSEHLFQSFKFEHIPKLAERIRTCSERPSEAFVEARRYAHDVRPDWRNVNIQKMDLALWLKFTQHQSLQRELLATGDAELVEDSDKDAFWGVGADRQGRNELGKALERLRAKLRHSPQVTTPVHALCELCGVKPKHGRHPYCGKTCASKACNYCHKKEKHRNHDFCGKTCAHLANDQQRISPTHVSRHRRPSW